LQSGAIPGPDVSVKIDTITGKGAQLLLSQT
jgi:hypothetical protein